MFFFYMLYCLLSCCKAQQYFGQCGENLDIAEPRIAGTIETASDPLGTWPWVASVGRYQDLEWEHLCGSVVISRKYVLTAAHCLVDYGLQLRLGDKDLKSPEDDFGANIREISEAMVHPKYNNNTAYYDIAILKVRPSLIYTSYIRPICMPPPSHDLDQYAEHHVTVTGWGFSSRNTPDGGESLRSVPIQIFPQRICNKSHTDGIVGAQEHEISRYLPDLFTPSLMCVGYERPLYGPCKGDSGSPLVKYQFDSSRYVLLGLVQGGIGACGDKDFPAIFTRIDAEEIYSFITRETGVSVLESDFLPPPPVQRPGVAGANVSPTFSALNKPPGADFTPKLDPRIEVQPTTSPPTDKAPEVANLDENGNSELMLLSKGNQYDNVSYLLDQGADVHHVNKYRQNALMLACRTNGTLRIVHLLLSKGIDINQGDDWERNALHYAAEAGNLPVLQSLLTKGLSVDSGDSDNVTPLCLAVQAGKYGTVKHLLELGANVSVRAYLNKRVPIHYTAILQEGISVTQLLLDHGADIDDRDALEETPLFISFSRGHLNTSKQLYQLGASLDVLNDAGKSVLHTAATFGHAEHIKWLHGLEGGSVFRKLLNLQDNEGRTALILATQSRQFRTVPLLLSYGAEVVNIRDNYGKNAIDYDREFFISIITRLLLGSLSTQ